MRAPCAMLRDKLANCDATPAPRLTCSSEPLETALIPPKPWDVLEVLLGRSWEGGTYILVLRVSQDASAVTAFVSFAPPAKNSGRALATSAGGAPSFCSATTHLLVALLHSHRSQQSAGSFSTSTGPPRNLAVNCSP